MKYYNRDNIHRYLADIPYAVKQRNMNQYLPLALSIANKFSTYSQYVGLLDRLDIIQYANLGLIEGWNKVNWEIVKKSPEPQKTISAFLSQRISGSIKRGIRKNATFIELDAELIRVDFDNATQYIDAQFEGNIFTFELNLNSKLKLKSITFLTEASEDMINHEVLNKSLLAALSKLKKVERKTLELSYAIGYKKKYNQDLIAKRLNKSISTIKRIKQTALKRLEKLLAKELTKL